MGHCMQQPEKYQLFSRFTKAEQELILSHQCFKSTPLFKSKLDIGLDYSLGIDIDDIPGRSRLLTTDEELKKYLCDIEDFYPFEHEKLWRCAADFFKFLTMKDRAKVPIHEDFALPISFSDAKHAVDSKAPVKTKAFHIGACEGFVFSINTDNTQEIKKSNIVVDKAEFKKHIRFITKSSWDELQSETTFENALKLISKGKENPHCVLFGTLRFFREKHRLPYHNEKDLQSIWSLICDKYPLHHSEKNTVILEESVFNYEKVWKQYDATYSTQILTYIADAVEQP
jgi:hypothetical protein